MNVEHDFKTLSEKRSILKWFDAEIGTEYECDTDTDGSGTIVFFELEPGEYQRLMGYLIQKGYIDAKEGL